MGFSFTRLLLQLVLQEFDALQCFLLLGVDGLFFCTVVVLFVFYTKCWSCGKSVEVFSVISVYFKLFALSL